MYFSFDFGWYSIHFNIARQEQGAREGDGVLNGKKSIKRDKKVLC